MGWIALSLPVIGLTESVSRVAQIFSGFVASRTYCWDPIYLVEELFKIVETPTLARSFGIS